MKSQSRIRRMRPCDEDPTRSKRAKQASIKRRSERRAKHEVRVSIE